MKLIELLNYLYNGKKVPKKVMFEGKKYIFNEETKSYEYYDGFGKDLLWDSLGETKNTVEWLNKKIEINFIKKIILKSKRKRI